MREVVRGWVWVWVVMLCGCHFSRGEHPDACKVDKDCKANARCDQNLGYCVSDSGGSNDDAGGSGGKGGSGSGGHAGGNDAGDASMQGDSGAGGSDAGNDSGMPMNTECDVNQAPQDCYDGPKKTKDVGVCRGGQRACIDGKYTPCLGQVLPSMETCNGKDDNCDGVEDEFAMQATCKTAMHGVCMAGELVCRGNYAVCEPVNTPSDEVCNGKDDNCDGSSDNGLVATQCYPANTLGCVVGSDGNLMCTGRCQAGHSACDNGSEDCPDAVIPTAEVCTTGSDLAADENCDGNIDEGCSCTNGAMRNCYSGPAGTEVNSPCHTGTQTCSTTADPGGAWSDCTGEVTPQRETCANIGIDDDCDGTADNYPDIPGLGQACLDDTKQGICRDGTWQCPTGATEPVCVGAAAQHELCDDVDQDCDGDPINGYDLSKDRNNCGKCDNACANGETCCNGVCTSIKAFRFDQDNCGGCGIQCGAGQYCCWNDCLPGGGKGGIINPDVCACKQDCGDKSCCGDTCVDLLNDNKNCGQCGNDCTNGIIAQQCCDGRCASICSIGR